MTRENFMGCGMPHMQINMFTPCSTYPKKLVSSEPVYTMVRRNGFVEMIDHRLPRYKNNPNGVLPYERCNKGSAEKYGSFSLQSAIQGSCNTCQTGYEEGVT